MKLLLASLTLAVLVFTGCSQKNPDVDMMDKNSSKVETKVDKKADDISNMDANNDASMDTSKANTEDLVAKTIAMLEGDINKVYFDFDQYTIRNDMESKIKSNARLLSATNSQNFSIKIEGNCDEWGTDEYNYALGLKRAKSVKESLISFGVNEDRIMIVSFGESNPTCTQNNKSCWDKNRRAEFKLLP